MSCQLRQAKSHIPALLKRCCSRQSDTVPAKDIPFSDDSARIEGGRATTRDIGFPAAPSIHGVAGAGRAESAEGAEGALGAERANGPLIDAGLAADCELNLASPSF